MSGLSLALGLAAAEGAFEAEDFDFVSSARSVGEPATKRMSGTTQQNEERQAWGSDPNDITFSRLTTFRPEEIPVELGKVNAPTRRNIEHLPPRAVRGASVLHA